MLAKVCRLALVVFSAALVGCQLTAQGPAYDVIVRNALIVDGTGAPGRAGEVAIAGDRIAVVGTVPATATARRVIDASGLVVAPGFIDLHTHSDLPLVADGTAQSKVRQGVTLDVLGESTTVAPRDGLSDARGEVRQDWTTFTAYFQKLQKQGISMNVASHVSAQQVRLVVLGYDNRAQRRQSSIG